MGVFSPFASTITSALASAVKSALEKASTSSGSSGSTSKSSSSSSSSGSSSSLKSLLDAEAEKYGVTPVSDTPGSPYYRETSSGGGGAPPSSSDGLNPLAVAGYKWGQGYFNKNETISDVIKEKLNQLQTQTQNALNSIAENWRPPDLPSPTTWQSPTFTTPAQAPKVETAPQVENVPAAAAPQQTATLPSGVTQGASGFTYQASLPPVLPTVDKLLETYRQVFGRADQDVQSYLQSPDFQQVLSGNIPMWMEADPMWRNYLRLLGISRRLQQQ